MYTGGVSSLAEQITNRIQGQEDVSSSSGHCFFCKDRVYLMERLSAEGLFFHRSCFQCYTCGSSLRLSAYTFDRSTGRFYCVQHSDSDPTVRRRRTDRSASLQTSTVSLSSAPSLSSADSLVFAGRRRSSVVSVKTATPERIELENYRRSSTKEAGLLEEEGEEPEEVSEEMLTRFNLDLDQEENHKSSSESEMEVEVEEEEEEVGASWMETLQLHLGHEEEEEEEEEEAEPEEEDGDDEMESSDEAGGDITPSDTPVEPDSTSSPLPCVNPSLTPSEPRPHVFTPSTASFVSEPDSTHNDSDTAPPTWTTPEVVMETACQKQASWLPDKGRGSFDDISPEMPPMKPLLLKDKWEEPEEEEFEQKEEEGESDGRRRRHRGAHTLPPRLHPPPLAGGGAFLLQLKGLREAPPSGLFDVEGGGARSLWRAVFPGNRKEKRKKKMGESLPAERTKKDEANKRRVKGVRGCLTEEESSDLLHTRNNRRSQRGSAPLQDSDGRSSCPTEVVGVLVESKEPSSLSVKETMFQRGQEEEDLDAKITRRVQRAARRTAKQEELKRLHRAQMIQRQLQQVEEKQRQLEERGVIVEKALRGEADYWEDDDNSPDIELHLEGLGKLDNTVLMKTWFQLVQQKNSLIRYESELVILARELELEDRQSRLQQELRERMAVDDHLKGACELVEERLILEEMLEVVEQRDSLVSLLEEQRLQERQEDHDLEEIMMTRPLGLSWT
nr:protein-methionine sulfoxide oxidase mical3b-like isoform X2 [Labrus bergylta]